MTRMSISYSQTGAVCATAPPRTATKDLFLSRLAGPFWDMLFGFVLSLFLAVVVYADEVPQGWVPEVLMLPEDAKVQMDRAVGSNIRMFSFSTGADVEDLFDNWSSALEREGYKIRPQQGELEAEAIEFSGHHILNAKIATHPASDGGRAVITFDATLE